MRQCGIHGRDAVFYEALKIYVSSLVNVVSLCTTLRVLDLTDSGFPLDKIWAALKYGGLQIEKLCLGGCHVGRKSTDCSQVIILHFPIESLCLFSLYYFTYFFLTAPKTVALKPFHLDISATCEKSCSSVLEACLAGVQCRSLSLRDNNLEGEMQGVIHALGNIKTLRRLDIGGANLLALRRSSKQVHAALISKTILDVVKLFSDDSPLEELFLSDARLGPHLSVLLNTLGAATSLRFLDISNNDLGHFGARILSKALELNTSLRSIVIDNNHLGVEGLCDLATALNINRTITSISYPVQDVCECLTRAGCDRSRILGAMTLIESCLERNRQPSNADTANFRITAGVSLLFNVTTAV
ncbi:unnamed protein product [Strongylus vulgaris]|uniref:CARMIL pleckstrin homology domain-containing protein n=1 Tax=Strongylus vulgaris TaxID=40348 RepID=A0A3P7K7X0_STRVU|nr:unnamed protein product [Strongylus vulgaris]